MRTNLTECRSGVPLYRAASRRFHDGRRISGGPFRIRGRAVNWRHGTIEQTEIDGQLSPVVSRMQNTPPENPDACTFDIKELNLREPLLPALGRKPCQPRGYKLDEAFEKCGNGFLLRKK